MPDIPDKPTHRTPPALAVFDSLLDSFPGRATTTAARRPAMLTSLIMRAAFRRCRCIACRPLRPARQDFLCDLAAAVATGSPRRHGGWHDEEELEAAEFAVLDGMPVVAIDNVSRHGGISVPGVIARRP